MEDPKGIEQIDDEEPDETQRIGEHRNVDVVAEEEREDADRPDHGKETGELKMNTD